MSVDFLDANVLVYAYDSSDPRKREIGRALIRRGLAGEAVVSAQVLSEFAAVLLHKIRPKAQPAEVGAILDALAPIRVVGADAGLVRRAVEAHASYGIHFYDGMIVAAAERAGAKMILSEDLADGREYFGVAVRNPFA